MDTVRLTVADLIGPFHSKHGGMNMPKQKTHKGMKKRFKVTASGKATKRSAFRGHILSKKSGKRKRGLRKGSLVLGAEARKIVEGLRPAS